MKYKHGFKLGAALTAALFALKNFSQITFASMGSSGGGGSGSSGSGGSGGSGSGGSGGSGGFTGGGSVSGNSGARSTGSGYMPFYWTVNNGGVKITINYQALGFAIIGTCIYLLLLKRSDDENNRQVGIWAYILPALAFMWCVDDSFTALFFGYFITRVRESVLNFVHSNYRNNNYDLRTPNLTLYQFQHLLRNNDIQLKDGEPNLAGQYKATYINAQELYSSLIRKYIAGQHSTLALKQYLVYRYYKAMHDEIINKAEQQTVDDVEISKIVIDSYAEYGHLVICKFKVTGNDNEAQINANFDSSFKRQNWVDYVIFDSHGKIVNIIYGGHFHLNGIDYNHQADLAGKTEEHDLRDDEHNMFDN